MSLQNFHYVFEDNNADTTIFLLHGTGGNERDLFPLVEGVSPRPNIVGLRGNISEHGMRRFFAREAPGIFDMNSIRDETAALADFLKAWYAQSAVSPEKTVFVGYSNGANMILAMLFRFPDLIRRAAVLHPMLPFSPEKVEVGGAELLVTYGEQDAMIPAAESRKVVDTLRKLGATLHVTTHSGGHELQSNEVQALQQFLLPQEKKKYGTALVVGRFQPFHCGHLHLLKAALEVAENVVIAIGSSETAHTSDNPLTFQTRLQLVQTVLEQEQLADRIQTIVPSPDFPSDEAWREALIQNVGDFEVVVGNNEWTNEVLAAAGYDTLTVPFARREEYQGVVIRERIRNGQPWEHSVPEYLISAIAEAFSQENSR